MADPECPLSAKSGQPVLPGLRHRQISGGEIGCPCAPHFTIVLIWLEYGLAMEVTHELPHSRP
jgi:hypothetical protein